MILESNPISFSGDLDRLKDFLLSPQNYFELLPADKISNFKADAEQCSFTATGGINIALAPQDWQDDNTLMINSANGSAFKFTLQVVIINQGAGIATSGHIKFESELTGFMAIMAKKPLQELFDFMTLRMKQIMNA